MRISKIYIIFLIFSSFIILNHTYAGNIQNKYQKLLASGDINYPPYEFQEDGIPNGFNVEILQAVASEMNLNITINLGIWNDVKNNLKEGSIDIITGMYYSKSRDKYFDFTVPHSIVSHSIFVRKNSEIKSLTDVADKNIIVQRGDIMDEFVKENYPFANIIYTSTPLEALELLSDGKYDCVLTSKFPGHFLIEENELDNLKSLQFDISPRKYCFAVTEGNTELRDILTQGLNIIKSKGIYSEIYEKWFGIYEEGPNYEEIVNYSLTILIVLLIVIFFIIIWNRSLRKSVALKTQNLSKELELRKQIQIELKQREEFLNSIFNAAENVSIVIFQVENDDLIFKQLNIGTVNLFGFTEEEIINHPIRYQPEEFKNKLPQIVKNLKEFKLGYSGEAVLKKKNGELFHGHLTIYRIKEIEKPITAVAIIVDLTKLKEVEEVKERLLKKLAVKNKELESFIYSVSHDLRSPLINIQGYTNEIRLTFQDILQNIEKQSGDLYKTISEQFDSDLKFSFEILENSVHKMDRLLKALLKLSRAIHKHDQKTEIDMVEFFQNLETTFEYQLKENKINFIIDTLPKCYTEYNALEQIFSNLVDNAIKYSDPGKDSYIKISGEKENTSSFFYVEDNGIGIEDNNLQKLFSIFQRFSPEKAEGEGIGLSIVSKLIDRLNGEIEVESEFGKYTKFKISVPCEENSSQN